MPQGVDIRSNSLRLTFSFEGKQHRPTLHVGDTPMAPTPANIKFATRLAAEIRDRIRLGVFSMAEYAQHFGVVGHSGATVALQLDGWLDVQRIEDSTKAGYRAAIRFWKAAPADDRGTALGDFALRAVRKSNLLKALASRPLLSGKTINNYVSVLREAFQLAVDDDLLTANVAAELQRAEHQSPPPDPFDADEREALLRHFAKRHPGHVANMVDFWFWTGLRTGEIFGLRWSNVDLARGSVLIAESIVEGKRKASTKTKVARLVHLNSRALAAIKRQRELTQAAGDAVFFDPRRGEAFADEQAFCKGFWKGAFPLTGLRYRRPYNMRHSYATAMLMAGMTPAFCARQLGHSIEVFLRTYSRWIDGAANDREMAKLEASIEAPAAARKESK